MWAYPMLAAASGVARRGGGEEREDIIIFSDAVLSERLSGELLSNIDDQLDFI